MYRSALSIAISRLKCLLWSMFFCFCFFHSAAWSNMTDPWQNFTEADFTFFCVSRYKLLLYITFKVVSNVTKSPASDLLHVKCNVTNRTVDCLPGVWVLVLYWSLFISLLLLLKVCYAYLFIVRFVSGVLQSALVLFAQKEMLLLQNPLWYAVFNKVCEITLSEVLATQMGVMRRSIDVSSFEMHRYDPFSPHSGSIPRSSC